jgi:hypothetical protein
MDKVTTDALQGQIPEITQSLDDLAREGARRIFWQRWKSKWSSTSANYTTCVMRMDTPWSFGTEREQHAQ